MRDWRAAVLGGVAGTAVLVLVLVVGESFVSTTVEPFGLLAGAVGVDQPAVGFALFVAVGVLGWPLVFLSLGAYLPGDDVVRAVMFSLALWVGFVAAFGLDYEGSLVVYALIALVAHAGYGWALGATYRRFADHALGEV